MKEVWKAAVGFESRYEVSNLGRVRSIPRYVECSRGGRVFLPQLMMSIRRRSKSSPYLRVSLSSVENGQRAVNVHRLVALTFLPKQPKGKDYVNHKNGNKEDNRASNLEWCSPKENAEHALANGWYSRGELCNKKVLTDAKVKRLIKLHRTGRFTLQKLADLLGTSKSNVHRVVKGSTWRHVTGF